MNATLRDGWFAAATIASSVLLAGPVSSQTLALSYGLDVNSGGVAHFETPVDRCSSVGPSVETAACSRPGLKLATNAVAELPTVRTSPPSPVKDMALSDGDAPESESASREPRVTPVYELPLLGSSEANVRLPRLEGGKDVTANSRTVDLNFRFGSRYRPMTNDDGWGPYKFTDAAYESRVQNNIKALGLELLFPFQ